MKILSGAMTEHWLDKRKRLKQPIACPGNYIRIPAAMMVKFQELRNKGQQKKLSLFEQQKKWEAEQEEV